MSKKVNATHASTVVRSKIYLLSQAASEIVDATEMARKAMCEDEFYVSNDAIASLASSIAHAASLLSILSSTKSLQEQRAELQRLRAKEAAKP